jgi:hypothetical protein
MPILPPFNRCPCCDLRVLDRVTDYACEGCAREFGRLFRVAFNLPRHAPPSLEVGQKWYRRQGSLARERGKGMMSVVEAAQRTKEAMAKSLQRSEEAMRAACDKVDRALTRVQGPATDRAAAALTFARHVRNMWIMLIRTQPELLDRIERRGSEGERDRLLQRAFDLNEGGLRERAVQMAALEVGGDCIEAYAIRCNALATELAADWCEACDQVRAICSCPLPKNAASPPAR